MAGPPRPPRNDSPAGAVTGRNFSRTDLERSSASGAATSGRLCMAIVGAAWGFDEVSGGIEESLTSEGPSANPPRRARVQARQIYSFARPFSAP